MDYPGSLSAIVNHIVEGADASNIFAGANASKAPLYVMIDDIFCKQYTTIEGKPPNTKNILPSNYAL